MGYSTSYVLYSVIESLEGDYIYNRKCYVDFFVMEINGNCARQLCVTGNVLRICFSSGDSVFSRPCTAKSHASFENSTHLCLPDLPTLESPDVLRTN